MLIVEKVYHQFNQPFIWLEVFTREWLFWLMLPVSVTIWVVYKIAKARARNLALHQARLLLEVGMKMSAFERVSVILDPEEIKMMKRVATLSLGLKARKIQALVKKSVNIYAETKDSSEFRFIQAESKVKQAIKDFWDSVSFVMQFDEVLKEKPASWKEALDW